MRHGRMRRVVHWGLLVSACMAAWLISDAQALGSGPPRIEGEAFSVRHGRLTLTASIQPNGLPTTYAVWVSRPGCPGPGVKCLLVSETRIASGEIAADADVFAVKVTFTMGRAESVSVGVMARNAAGRAFGRSHRVDRAAAAQEAVSEPTETRVFASEVNLRAVDVPGFKLIAAMSGESNAQPGPLPRRAEKCDGGPVAGVASYGVASPIFQQQKRRVQTVLSAVYPMRDSGTASAYIAAADARRGRGCLQREEIRKRASLRGLARGRTEVAALHVPLPNVPASGVRVWRCLPGSTTRRNRLARTVTDRIWFAVGRYVVTLFYIATQRNATQRSEGAACGAQDHCSAV